MVSDFVEPRDWWLEIAADRQAGNWAQSQLHPTSWGRWNAYLNQLCLETCLTWLQTERFPAAQAEGNAADWAPIWEVVNGSVVTVDGVRLALIPTEAIDQTELVVPQEWVDIPDWAADYYLAVQVTPPIMAPMASPGAAHQPALFIYGYATHQQLKSEATYDPDDRTYCLDQTELTADLHALWFAVPQYTPTQTRATVAPLTPIAAGLAQPLIERLSDPTEVLPRLAVPFGLWSALLDQPHWRRQLYHQRQQGQTMPLVTALGNWLQGQFEPVWRSVEQVLLPAQWAIATRSVGSDRPLDTDAAMVYRARELSLGGGAMALLLGMTPLSPTETRINLQLHPAGGAIHLPGATQMRLLTGAGVEIAHAQGTAAETIQLQFRVNQGERFEIEITCNDQTLTERFEL